MNKNKACKDRQNIEKRKAFELNFCGIDDFFDLSANAFQINGRERQKTPPRKPKRSKSGESRSNYLR